MGRYIDGFVILVCKDRIDAYRALAEKTAQIWKEHGALDYWECVGDDLHVEPPGPRSFPQVMGATDDETVVFAWAVYESREARDRANEKIMADPRMAKLMKPENQLFDCERMAFGGFSELLHA